MQLTAKKRTFQENIQGGFTLDDIQAFNDKLLAFFYGASQDITESLESDDFTIESTQQVRIDITCTIRTQEQKDER